MFRRPPEIWLKLRLGRSGSQSRDSRLETIADGLRAVRFKAGLDPPASKPQ